MSSVGLSQVNFDVQELEDDEEQQLEKEDEEREREIHELLSNELPDDLLDEDDDNLSFSSQGLGSSTHGHRSPEFNPDQSFEHHNDGDDHSSRGQRPYNEPQHPLLTRRGEDFIQRSGFTGNVLNHQSKEADHPESVPRGYEFVGGNYGYSGEIKNSMELSGDNSVEYGDRDNVVHHNQDYMGYYQPDGDHTGRVDGGSDGIDGGCVVHSGGYYISGGYTQVPDYGNGYSMEDASGVRKLDQDFHSGETELRRVYSDRDENFNIYSNHSAIPSSQQEAFKFASRSDMNDDFKVHYTKRRPQDDDDCPTEITEGVVVSGAMPPASSELAQLQVLHRARGRKLEELTKEMALKEKDYERQIRVLNHHLSLMKGERDGMGASLKHAQEIASNRKNEIEELDRRLQESDIQKERLNSEKNETKSELEAARKTIESLHQQLMELEKSESLSRAREQHENIVMATRKRYEEEVVRLKQKLDDVNNSLVWKNEESKRLHDELSQARKEADRLRLDRAETVNRLTRSLEQSQKQNEELLKAGSTQEISLLQNQLLRTQREKEELQQHYKTIEMDLGDLKEQLRIYESASKLGFSVKEDNVSPTTDGIKRNLEADEWRTPGQGTSSRNAPSEEALSGLQKEFQHCLALNRSKREEIQQLRSQIDAMKRDLTAKTNETERLELLVKKQEKRVLEQEKKIADFEELTRNPDKVIEQRESELRKLKEMTAECGAKIDQYVKREKELEQLNLQLKNQMSEMVRDYDADKQKSIEQCRQSCLEFHDQAMNTMKEQLKQEHEDQLTQLRHELKRVSSELDQAKESYVTLSEQSRWIERQAREQCEEEAKRNIEELQMRWDQAKSCEIVELRQNIVTEMERNFAKEKVAWQKNEDELVKGKIETEIALAKMEWVKLQMRWDQAKSCEIVELRQNIVTEMERNFAKEKVAWQKNEDELVKGKIETEIALAKMEWVKEQQKLREEAVQTAVSMAEKEWMEKYGKTKNAEEWEEKISNLKKEWDNEKKREIQATRQEVLTQVEREQSEKLSASREEWNRLKTVEIEREVEMGRKQWEEEMKTLVNEAKETAVTKAKVEWSKEQTETHQKEMSKAVEEAKTQALAIARKNWEKEKDTRLENILQSEKLKWEVAAEEEKSRALETAVLLAEEKWQRENQGKISEAVREALEVAQATWKKERETAIESAVSESLHAAKEAWNESKVREIEQVLSSARKQWITDFDLSTQEPTASLRRTSNGSIEETNKTFSYLEKQYSKNLKEFRETELKKAMEENARALKELETKYKVKLTNMEETHRLKLDDMSKQSQDDKEKEIKQLETEYQNKLQNIVDEIEGKFLQKKKALEEDWVKKYERERAELEDAYRTKFEKDREGMGREMREKYENRVEETRKKLEQQLSERLQSALESARHEWEEEQEEDRIALEEQHLKKLGSELEKLREEMEEQAELKLTDAETAARLLEQQLQTEKLRYKSDIENLQQELRDIKQLHYKPKGEKVAGDALKRGGTLDRKSKTSQTEPSQDQRWISLTELSDDAMSNSKLQELRKQYLATTAQLKEDLKQHAIETRKNAAKALRTEVLKERHATAKRLRKYYLECLKQILDDDKEAFKNDQNPRSKEEKIRIMEDRLRLPDEKDEMIKSQDSTLTNVTSLTGGNSEQYPITAQDQNPGISETTHSDPSSRRQLPNMNQDHHALQNISRDSRLQSGHPSFTTAYVNRPKQVPGGHGREQRGGEWVNYSRGDKHGGSTNFAFDDREGHSTKNSSKDVNGANLRGSPASSTESLYSFNRDQQIDLPQVMNFSQQEIPAHLLQSDQDEDTDSSCSSGISETSKDYTRTDEDNRSERYRRKGQKRDVRFYEDERTRNSRIAKGSHTQNKLSSSRTTDRTFLRPLIGTRTGNELPTKLTSSLPKPIGDVLPSKPLSPVNRVAPKFSYTMHSNSRNPNN